MYFFTAIPGSRYYYCLHFLDDGAEIGLLNTCPRLYIEEMAELVLKPLQFDLRGGALSHREE